MARRRSPIETFSLSFLDVISCGFGAIILLLIIMLAFEPQTLVELSTSLRERIAESQASREQVAAEYGDLGRELETKKRQLAELQTRLEGLSAELQRVERQRMSAQATADASARIEEQLQVVRQKLSEEMRRLLNQPGYTPPDTDAPIGGIPVDSEYIIFIIDTSGSMQRGAWPLVVRKMQEVLKTYPQVKGLQVLNDQGAYMFPTYAGQWIPDTPARREVVIERLRRWSIFSASNPAPGILAAIRTFYRADRRASIFVFGDDFNGRSIDEVVHAVAQLNRRNATDEVQVRIHTFGFPVLPLLEPARYQENFFRFAHLMRLLAEQNAGSFVGLNALR